MALYRKWRPLSFEDVVEQRHIVDTLKNSIKKDAVSHAYLFCGTRGTGKTTLAKIFSRAVNCLNPIDGNPCNSCEICRGILDGSVIDVIEIDAASNNGVDDVRQIKDAVMYVPAVARYKVYIIDEVHMLSTGAFNALLKTLEEPPKSVVFILATTEPHKLPATILSRCQRFDFKRISLQGLTFRLKKISEEAGISVEESALNLIARLAQGGMRDAISLLDQCMATGKSAIGRDDVIGVAGLSAQDTVDRLSLAIVDRDANLTLTLIGDALAEGSDLPPLCGQLVEWFRNLMLYQTGGAALKLIDWSDDELLPIKEAAGRISPDEAVFFIKELSDLEARLKWAENQRILAEMFMVRLCKRSMSGGSDDMKLALLEDRIAELERELARLKSAGPVPKAESVSGSGRAAKPIIEEPRPKDVPQKASGQILTTSGKELSNWADVVDYVQKSGKMKVYAYLLDTKCILGDDETAFIAVNSEDGLKKVVLSRNDSLEIISEAIFKVLGKRLNVRVKDEKELGQIKQKSDEDPVFEKVKQFAIENDIHLEVRE